LRHDKWLSMMYQRLALLRVLLAESGGLFMTLDDHEAHRARVLMDELFGAENFLANITWEKTRSPEDTGSLFLETHTHVIAYARNAEIWCPNPSAVKVPTIWNAAEVGAARKAQTVAPSHPAALYPLIPNPWGSSGEYCGSLPAPTRWFSTPSPGVGQPPRRSWSRMPPTGPQEVRAHRGR
jgi:hypothetical protein